MKFGAQIPGNNTTWDAMVAVAKTMDAGRWESAWTFDHFVPPLAFMDESGDCLEGWMALAGLGAVTTRLRLGTVVTGNTYRNPALLAKMTATLDAMTGGRAILGIGAAWHVREHEAYGWDFPSIKERSDRLEEACELIRALFRADGPVNFQGKYYRLDNAPFAPRHTGPNPIPIMVGGGGEKRTLRTLAKFGDILNVGGSPEDFARKVDILNQHCADVGRDPSEITKTAFSVLVLQDDEAKAEGLRERFAPNAAPEDRRRNMTIGNAEHIVGVLRRYQEAGADGAIFQSIPNNPRLYERINDEILAAFD
ncbi:MAG: TIGR03560 family F420-dependent LLM class oxidoreductase [Dehalococcoidia bacterium]|nr:TIGR03560 family F420-dependent LLM class oxidoreductase [Dehalococcoidia bacterium]MCB9485588.1 TIGR03560 family F420-dependent LLM class oxidoreductase [Thermoflexaceae bacterium]